MCYILLIDCQYVIADRDIEPPVAQVKYADRHQCEAIIYNRQAIFDGEMLVCPPGIIRLVAHNAFIPFFAAVFLPPRSDFCNQLVPALTLDTLNVMVIGAACQYGTQGVQVDFIGQFFFSKEDAARALKVLRYRVKVLGQDALQLIFPALALADLNTRMAALVAYQISIADTSVLCAANPHLFRKII